jgi:purine-cytosine permease-like protein
LKLLIDIIGWTGSACILAAYALNSFQKIKSDSLAFQLLNLFGGIFFIVYTATLGAFASTALNVVWVIIALIALARMFSKKTSA